MISSCAVIFELIGGFFTALFGAGFGAFAAYLFAKRKDEERQRSEQHGEMVAAIYTMFNWYRSVENFSRKFLTDDRSSIHPDQIFHILYQQCPPDRISIRGLNFLADRVDAQLLYDLSHTEARYMDFIDALTERNRDCRSLMRAAIDRGIRPGDPIEHIPGDFPELDLIIEQNRNLCNAALWARDSIFKDVDRLQAARRRRFDEFPPLPFTTDETD